MSSYGATHEDAFKKWSELSNSRGMTLVVAGQSGTGKSTLVTNLLRLSDRSAEAPVDAHSFTPITTKVKFHNSCINGVNITIIDTPGLAGASDDDQVKVLAQLSEKTKGKVDMLLYCVGINPSSKINESDHRIIKLLTTAFTSDIWERAILVLTFADYVKERHQKNKTKNPTVQSVMERYAMAFEKVLGNSIDHMTVVPVLQNEDTKTRPAKQIAAFPAGETPGEEILPGIKWNACIYEEVLKKCGFKATPPAASGGALSAAVGFVAGGLSAIPRMIRDAISGWWPSNDATK